MSSSTSDIPILFDQSAIAQIRQDIAAKEKLLDDERRTQMTGDCQKVRQALAEMVNVELAKNTMAVAKERQFVHKAILDLKHIDSYNSHWRIILQKACGIDVFALEKQVEHITGKNTHFAVQHEGGSKYSLALYFRRLF